MKRENHYEKFKKEIFLNYVKDRLEQEVKPYLDYQETAQIGGVGTWSLIRMLLPVVEGVSETINVDRVAILRQIGIEFPNLTWEMFRHGLIHGILPREIYYQGRKISWATGMNAGMITSGDLIGLDIVVLYENFIQYIDKEKLIEPDKMVKVVTGVEFIDSTLKDELDKILNN